MKLLVSRVLVNPWVPQAHIHSTSLAFHMLRTRAPESARDVLFQRGTTVVHAVPRHFGEHTGETKMILHKKSVLKICPEY